MNNKNDLTRFNTGGTHEQSPIGGIPVGNGNFVEENETKQNDFVYSNRLFLDENIVAQFNLPKSLIGKSIADATKIIDGKFKDRTDKISLSTKDSMLQKIGQAQEAMKPQEPEQQMQQMQPQAEQQLDPSMMSPEMMDPNMMQQQMQQPLGQNQMFLGGEKKPGIDPYMGSIGQGAGALGAALSGNRDGAISGLIGGGLTAAGTAFGGPIGGMIGGALAAPISGAINGLLNKGKIQEENRNNHMASANKFTSDFAYGGNLNDNTIDPIIKKSLATRKDSLNLHKNYLQKEAQLKKLGYTKQSSEKRNFPNAHKEMENDFLQIQDREKSGGFTQIIQPGDYRQRGIYPSDAFREDDINGNKSFYKTQETGHTGVLNPQVPYSLYHKQVNPTTKDTWVNEKYNDGVTVYGNDFGEKYAPKPRPQGSANRSTAARPVTQRPNSMSFTRPIDRMNQNNKLAYGGKMYAAGGQIDPIIPPKKPLDTMDFQNWMDKNNSGWLNKGNLNRQGGYGNFGTNTRNAYKNHGKTYNDSLLYNVDPLELQSLKNPDDPFKDQKRFEKDMLITESVNPEGINLDMSKINKTPDEKSNKFDFNKLGSQLGQAARYAPIAMNAFQLSQLKKPQVESLNRLDQRYNPEYVDEKQLQNIANSEMNNVSNSLTSATNGSQGALRNNLLAASLNRGKTLSSSYNEATAQNRATNERGQAFNAEQNVRNQGIDTMEKDINAKNMGNYDTQRSKLLSDIGNNIGGVGKEEVFKQIAEKTTGYNWLGEYMKKNPNATPEEAIEAHKQEQSGNKYSQVFRNMQNTTFKPIGR